MIEKKLTQDDLEAEIERLQRLVKTLMASAGATNTEAELCWIEENERLRAEIIRHGWSVDCSRCAALIGSQHGEDA